MKIYVVSNVHYDWYRFTEVLFAHTDIEIVNAFCAEYKGGKYPIYTYDDLNDDISCSLQSEETAHLHVQCFIN